MVRARLFFTLLFVFFLLSSCAAPTKMTRQGQAVEVVENVSAETCRFQTIVSCRLGGNFQTYDENITNCQRELRNKAALNGATHLIISEVGSEDRATNWAGSLNNSGCNNCVRMAGKAYRCQ